MLADRKWVERNLGFDPITTPPPPETFAVKRVAKGPVKKSARVTTEDFRREIIDFDSEATEGREFMAFSTSTGLSRFTDIAWPRGLAPQTGPKPKGNGKGPLPRADVLVVTWTVGDGRQGAALARDPQRLRSADQGRRHLAAAGAARRADLQGVRPLEHGL